MTRIPRFVGAWIRTIRDAFALKHEIALALKLKVEGLSFRCRTWQKNSKAAFPIFLHEWHGFCATSNRLDTYLFLRPGIVVVAEILADRKRYRPCSIDKRPHRGFRTKTELALWRAKIEHHVVVLDIDNIVGVGIGSGSLGIVRFGIECEQYLGVAYGPAIGVDQAFFAAVDAEVGCRQTVLMIHNVA